MPGWFLTELPGHILYIKIRITSPLIWQWARDAYFFHMKVPDRGLQNPRFYHSAALLRDLEGPVDRGSQIVTAEDNDCHGVTSRLCWRSCGAGVCSPFTCKSRVEYADAGLVINSLPADLKMCAKIS